MNISAIQAKIVLNEGEGNVKMFLPSISFFENLPFGSLFFIYIKKIIIFIINKWQYLIILEE